MRSTGVFRWIQAERWKTICVHVQLELSAMLSLSLVAVLLRVDTAETVWKPREELGQGL